MGGFGSITGAQGAVGPVSEVRLGGENRRWQGEKYDRGTVTVVG